MPFFSKSKKNNQNAAGLPTATRNIHTSEGTSTGSSSPINGIRDRDGPRLQTPTPTGVNNPMNSLGPGTSSPDQSRMRRDRADSEPQVRRVPSDIESFLFVFPPSLTIVGCGD